MTAVYAKAGTQHLAYRPDIDGMRAIAVSMVVLFHFFQSAFPGGFIGVDIFFVISGFLITSILRNDGKSGALAAIVLFYERRVRRILPALFLMLAGVSVGAVLIFAPRDVRDLGQSMLAAIGFGSNFYFWLAPDKAEQTRILGHTWSLAVEEQYYIFFPPFLFFVMRWFPKHVTAILAAICALSLLGSLAIVGPHATAAFYATPARAWELLLGAMLSAPHVWRWPNRTANALSLVGLAAIAVSCFVTDNSSGGSGWSVIVPCIGAFLLIWSGPSAAANRLLSAPPLLFLGRISYSLYLWHWPLFVLATYALARALTVPERLIVIAVSILISALSWRYVEQRFRNRQLVTRRAIFASAAILAAILVSAGLLFVFARNAVALHPAGHGAPAHLIP